MGLDFGIVRKRKGGAYKSNEWEDVVWGRNCGLVKEIVLNNISTYNSETNEAELTIGTLSILNAKLAEHTKIINFNRRQNMDDELCKLFNFIAELSEGIAKDISDYEYEEIEYDYKLIDSY